MSVCLHSLLHYGTPLDPANSEHFSWFRWSEPTRLYQYPSWDWWRLCIWYEIWHLIKKMFLITSRVHTVAINRYYFSIEKWWFVVDEVPLKCLCISTSSFSSWVHFVLFPIVFLFWPAPVSYFNEMLCQVTIPSLFCIVLCMMKVFSKIACNWVSF